MNPAGVADVHLAAGAVPEDAPEEAVREAVAVTVEVEVAAEGEEAEAGVHIDAPGSYDAIFCRLRISSISPTGLLRFFAISEAFSPFFARRRTLP